jgi:glycosyltransferase involved in cell wall biosynthesis
MARTDGRPFVVQQSFPTPRPTTNPYLVMLGRSLSALDGVALRTFSWRSALLGRYDVFHVHWPEILVSGHSRGKTAVKQLLFVLLLLRLRVTRTPLVRTMHNLELPTGISRREIVLLRWAERWTALWIVLNPVTRLAPERAVATVLHGHYRDWFAPYPRAERTPGRLTFVGLIRRYKGVERLIDAFGQTRSSAPELSLRLAGNPSTDELADVVRSAAAGDERISARLEFLDDADLVREITAAELVVLPYRAMHNSGSVLAALSLDRPVLVPDNEVNRRLAAEVGPGWFHFFTDELGAEELTTAVAALRGRPPVAPPDLSARNWDNAGRAHLDAYRRARQLTGARRR